MDVYADGKGGGLVFIALVSQIECNSIYYRELKSF